MKKKVCMVVPSFTAKGGITSVVNGYRNSQLTEDYDVRFIETYCDGSVIQKTSKALSAYLKFIYTALFWKPNLVHVHSSFGGSFYRKALIIEIASLKFRLSIMFMVRILMSSIEKNLRKRRKP